jgi:hypothetical protein
MPPKKKMDAVENRTRSDRESGGIRVETYQIVTLTMAKQLAFGCDHLIMLYQNCAV